MNVVKKKIIIGITGLIGNGKTEAAKFFKKKGIKVIDVDNFAHRIYKKGTKLYQKIIKTYGNKILDSKNNIKRNILGKIVFSNVKEYKNFIKLIYPVLNKYLLDYIKKLKDNIIMVDMAVLFQSGFYKYVDKIILIKANDKLWKKKFSKHKNYNIILKIRKIQKKFLKPNIVALSDVIVYNNYKKKSYIKKLKKLFNEIIKKINNK